MNNIFGSAPRFSVQPSNMLDTNVSRSKSTDQHYGTDASEFDAGLFDEDAAMLDGQEEDDKEL